MEETAVPDLGAEFGCAAVADLGFGLDVFGKQHAVGRAHTFYETVIFHPLAVSDDPRPKFADNQQEFNRVFDFVKASDVHLNNFGKTHFALFDGQEDR